MQKVYSCTCHSWQVLGIIMKGSRVSAKSLPVITTSSRLECTRQMEGKAPWFPGPNHNISLWMMQIILISPKNKAEPLKLAWLNRKSVCQMYMALTSKHTGVRTVQHYEFSHHFRVVNCTEPCDDATPVMPHEKTSVVSWGEDQKEEADMFVFVVYVCLIINRESERQDRKW